MVDARHQVQGNRHQEPGLIPGTNDGVTVRLHQTGGDFGHKLVRRHGPDGCQAQLGPGLTTQTPGHIHRRTEKAAGAGDIHEQVAVRLARLNQRRIGQRLPHQGLHGLFLFERNLQGALMAMGQVGHHHGVVRVEATVIGYQKRKLGSREVLDTVYLDLPSTVFETEGIWFTIPEHVLVAADLDERSVPGALHAAEHAGIGMMPLMAICDRWDIGGLSTNWHPQTGVATIFIYEAYPGGAGISPVAYRAGVDHLQATVESIRACPCVSGCPSCVQSPKCGNNNKPLDKKAALVLLNGLVS